MPGLIEAGLTVTVIGMSTVFVLLGLLVWLVQLMSHLDSRIGEAADGEPPGDDGELISVIGAAIRLFRSRHTAKRGPK